jgi:hypothetical protein
MTSVSRFKALMTTFKEEIPALRPTDIHIHSQGAPKFPRQTTRTAKKALATTRGRCRGITHATLQRLGPSSGSYHDCRCGPRPSKLMRGELEAQTSTGAILSSDLTTGSQYRLLVCSEKSRVKYSEPEDNFVIEGWCTAENVSI